MSNEADIIKAMKNMGHDISCGACMSQAFTGTNSNKHTCQPSMLAQLEEFQGLSNLVGRFSESMRARLWEKMTEGYQGWADATRRDAILTEMRDRLRVSVGEYQAGDRTKLVDVANLCAILWMHELRA